MKGYTALLIVLLLVLFTWAGPAEGQRITLPDGIHSITAAEGMVYQQPAADEADLKGVFLLPPDLEMLVFSYEMEDTTVYSLAESLVNNGRQAEVREISGVEFLVFQDVDESDGAPCIGYSYLSGGRMIEISFFYATQEAMDLTVTIMESFQ